MFFLLLIDRWSDYICSICFFMSIVYTLLHLLKKCILLLSYISNLWKWGPFWKFQTLNAQLHIPGIISVKFHYNWIKKIFSNFHGYHGNGSHFENVKPRSTSTQPMDLSCEVPLLSNKKKKNPEEQKIFPKRFYSKPHNYLGLSNYTKMTPSAKCQTFMHN